MKLLTRFREEFTSQTHADINVAQQKSKAKTKANAKSALSRLPQDRSAIIPSLKISLR